MIDYIAQQLNKIDSGIYTAIIIIFIVIWTIKKFLFKDNFLQIHDEIHELLTELRIRSNAERVLLFEYHNGDYNNKDSLKKFSVTHETTLPHITNVGLSWQNIPISLFLPLNNQVNENTTKLYTIKELPFTSCKPILESQNVEAYMVLPYYKKLNLYGFIMIQWIDGDKSKEFENTTIIFEDIRNHISASTSKLKR